LAIVELKNELLMGMPIRHTVTVAVS
jgi:hypothetical protein